MGRQKTISRMSHWQTQHKKDQPRDHSLLTVALQRTNKQRICLFGRLSPVKMETSRTINSSSFGDQPIVDNNSRPHNAISS